MPVFMAATPDFVAKSPDTVVAYLKAWLEVARDFKDNPNKVADAIYAFYTSKGYECRRRRSARRLRPSMWTRASPPTSSLHAAQAEMLLKEKKIAAIPDWSKALRPDLWAKASA